MVDKKKLLKNINKFFGEDNKSLDDIPHENLLWYLETLFLQLVLADEQIGNNQKSYLKLFNTYNDLVESKKNE